MISISKFEKHKRKKRKAIKYMRGLNLSDQQEKRKREMEKYIVLTRVT